MLKELKINEIVARIQLQAVILMDSARL